jgi:hypothetical protein
VIAASVLVAVTTAPAFACSCARVSVAKGLRSSGVVFFGEPVDEIRFGPSTPTSESPGVAETSGGFLTKFEVDRVYKGKVGKYQWVATTAGFGGACGYRFERQPYVIAAGRVPSGSLTETALAEVRPRDLAAVQRSVVTSLCGMMNEPSVGEVEDILGGGHEPR